MRTHLSAVPALLIGIAVNGVPIGSASAQNAPRAPIAVVQKVPLPGVFGRMDHLSLMGSRFVVAALGNNSIEVVDGSARVLASIPGQDMPQGVRYVPEIDRLFVANGGASKGKSDVRVYSGDKYQFVKSFDQNFEGADNLRYDPAAKLMYVSYE